MCGVAGILDLKASREIDQAALRRMTEALTHRGPDGEGFFAAPGVGLGHRRLAIIDRDGGAQPFHAQTAGCVLSFNGEIYNYRELSRSLSARSLCLRTRSDTEVLAEGLALNGDAFVQQLRGMFAFAFWAPKEKRLTLARDRLGEKPLYYAETADGFLLFASEIGALLASGLLQPELNPEAAADYFFYGYVPDPKTIYRNIFKLPPGHMLTAQPGAPIRLKRYWRPTFTPDATLSFDAAAEELRARLDDAVAIETVSDAPLGLFLSGGVDSAGVLAALSKVVERPAACTIGFNELSHDETDLAQAMAKKFGAEHHVETADFDIASLTDDVARAFGEPFADTAAFPGIINARLARRYVTVALSGDGGDEIFAGYRRYPMFLAEEAIRAAAPTDWRRALFGPAGALYPKLDWAPRPLRLKTTLQALAMSRADAYAAAMAINLPARAAGIMSGDLKAALQDYRPQQVVSAIDAPADDPLAFAQYADLMTWLPGRMLTKIDRTSMAHSLEMRPPLLDYKLVEWAGALPPAFKLRRGVGKRILKEALAPRLGRDTVNRQKRGFDMPIAEWLRREAGNPLRLLDQSRAWRDCGLIDDAYVQKMRDDHMSGASNCAAELWSVVMFDAFLRTAKAFDEITRADAPGRPLQRQTG